MTFASVSDRISLLELHECSSTRRADLHVTNSFHESHIIHHVDLHLPNT